MLIFLRHLRINKGKERDWKKRVSSNDPCVYTLISDGDRMQEKKKGAKTAHLQTRFDQISRATTFYRIGTVSVLSMICF